MSRPGGLGDGLRLAVGTLTVVPVRPPSTVDAFTAGTAMALAWLVALLPAAAVGALCWAGDAVSAPPLLVGAAAVAVLALFSRGLHLDGLADTADGLAASYDRERALQVMRTGDVGPVGAATLVLVLLAQASAIAVLVVDPLMVGLAVVLSRAMLAVACGRGVPAARASGLGATVAGSVPQPVAALVVVVVACCGTGVAVASDAPWWSAVLATACALLAAGAVLARSVSRLGGITGDVLGAVVELSLTGALAALAVAR
ncbi:adenosylcobinamide-GDP ribazoletransferase [Angustibacter sp. McL0619]|uniref:adenosylcobinamide-GDP ribazoletransferase n=1 Tax=Angustibacter sp. McL0619 TaxID=3415676 RepID=UPI003CE769D8